MDNSLPKTFFNFIANWPVKSFKCFVFHLLTSSSTSCAELPSCHRVDGVDNYLEMHFLPSSVWRLSWDWEERKQIPIRVSFLLSLLLSSFFLVVDLRPGDNLIPDNNLICHWREDFLCAEIDLWTTRRWRRNNLSLNAKKISYKCFATPSLCNYYQKKKRRDKRNCR